MGRTVKQAEDSSDRLHVYGDMKERRGEKRRDRKGGRGEKMPEQALMGKSPMVCISRTLFRLLHIEGIDRILASVY